MTSMDRTYKDQPWISQEIYSSCSWSEGLFSLKISVQSTEQIPTVIPVLSTEEYILL